MNKQNKLEKIYFYLLGEEEETEKTKAFLKRYWILKPLYWITRITSGYLMYVLTILVIFGIPLAIIMGIMYGVGIIPNQSLRNAITDVFTFYGKILLLLIPYGAGKIFSKGLSLKERMFNVVKSIIIIAVGLTIYSARGGDEDNDDNESIDWWNTYNGIAMFFYCLIASCIGIAMGEKEKDKSVK
jgi:hypothetical protein